MKHPNATAPAARAARAAGQTPASSSTPSVPPALRLLSLILCCALAFQPAPLDARGTSAAATNAGPAAGKAPPAKAKGEAARHDGQLLVRFRRQAAGQDVDELVASLGLRRGARLRGASGLERLAVEPGRDFDLVLSALRSSPAVELAEPNFIITADQFNPAAPPLSDLRLPYHAAGVGPRTAAELLGPPFRRPQAAEPSSTVVAVIDSGIDFAHPGLSGHRWVNARERKNRRDDDRDGYADDFHGWDYVSDSNEPLDESGHGTGVAGVITAAGAGEARARFAWRASLMSLRVLDGRGEGELARAVEAIDYAASHGASVINLSWGLDEPSSALREAVERAGARGGLVVCAAGNGGRNTDAAPRFPAGYGLPFLVAVASTDAADNLSRWSNWGPSGVAVAAPGEQVTTAGPRGRQVAVAGTSVSAAAASGVAGLVRAARPGLSAEQTRDVILSGVRRVAALHGRVASGGVVEVSGALAALDALTMGDDEQSQAPEREGVNPEAKGNAAVFAPQGPEPASGGAALNGEPTPNNLPNLDELRLHVPGAPRAIPPVPSTRRRCPPQAPHCAAAAAATPTTRDYLASFSARALFALVVMTLGRPAVNFPALDLPSGLGGYYTSDAPDAASLPMPPSPAAAAFFVAAPTALAVTDNLDTRVSLGWSSTWSNFRVERASAPGSFTLAGTSPVESFDDNGRARGNSYLYRVCAADASGNCVSPYSDPVMGTAVTFLDPQLVADVTTVKAQHIIDLRVAVNGVRRLAGLPDAAWAEPTLAPQAARVKASHVQELRDRLDEALAALDIAVTPYLDPTLTTGASATPLRKAHVEQLRARATRANLTAVTLGDGFSAARLNPSNRTGGVGVDPYSRNFQWSLPLVALPGRAGLDLGLTLSYNSLVWTKDGGSIAFDADRGSPSPGFRLGFPVIQPRFFNPQIQQAGQPARYSYLLVTPAGARVELRQVGTSNVYEAADSSNYQVTEVGGALELRTGGGALLSFAMRDGEFRCHELRDRQGNYVAVNYDGAGQISTVVDTLGRVLTFNYDSFQNLISITQPWKRETETGSVQETHTWASFGYANLTLQPSFSNLTPLGAQAGTVIPVVERVGLADGSYFKFSYNGWGQVWKVTRFAADSVVGGVPQDTHPLSYNRLNLPGSDLLAASPQSDCPRFTQHRLWAESAVMSQSAEVTTSYSAWSPDPASCDTTAPDGTLQREFYGTEWKRGLTTQSEVWFEGVRRKWTTLEWEHDGAASAAAPTNPRVSETNVYDAEGNRRRTTVAHTSFGLPQDVVEYHADAVTPLRTTRTDYELSAEYTSRRIIGLPAFTKLYEGAAVAANLRSKVGYVYDDNTLAGYLQALPAAATQHYGASYGTGFRWRGNLSRARRYEVNQQNGAESGAFAELQSGYFVTGTVASTTDAGGHQSSVSYADAFFDNVNRNTFAYPTVVTDPDGFTTSTWYNYDMGVMTKKRTPKPNETTNLPGPSHRLIYDAAGRTRKAINGANNSHIEWVYPATNTSVQKFETIEDASLTDPNRRAYEAEILDGLGRVRATSRELPGSAGGFAGRLFYFDAAGRIVRTYNPTEIDADWNAAGDDAAAGWVYTAQSYDWNGRPRVTTNPDATTREVTYGGCGCAGGEIATAAGELVQLPPQSGAGAWTLGRRTRRTHRDVLGRPFKVEVLNRDGTPYTTAVTAYNARDQVTSVKEYKGAATADGSCPAGTCQVTTSTYDGHGRLLSHRLPQYSAPATFAYNADDTIQQKVDPRGATSTYSYNNDRGLVTGIAFGAPAGVTATPAHSFTYDAVGNRKTQTDQGGTATYQYDNLARLTSETRTFNGLGGSYTLGYTYNLADQLASLTDPTGARVDYGYDKAGNLLGVTGTPYGNVTQYASGMKYRASGALKEAGYGNGLKLSLGYDARLRLRRYHVRVPTAPAGTADRSLYDYEYEADGRVSFAYDRTDPGFDRSNLYDLAGRLIDSRTASAAFYQSFAYDEFNHMTSRGNGSWRHYDLTTSAYRNNRNISTTNGPLSFPSCCPPQPVVWSYDAAGNVTRDHNKEYTYDAAGNKVRVMELNTTFAAGGSPQLWIYQDYDASGERVKRVEQTPAGAGTFAFVTTHYVRSSVLRGKVVTELDQNGAKRRTSVYANGTWLAVQESNQVRWVHEDPVTGGRRETAADGTLALRLEFDPLRNEAALTDPAPPDEPTPDYEYVGNYENGGNPYDGPSGCALDGQPLPCSMLFRVGREGGTVRFVSHDEWRGTESNLNIHGIFAFYVPRSQVDGDDARDTEQAPTPEPCDVQVPTDANSRAVIGTILGENTPYGFLGTRQYGADQYGTYKRRSDRPAPTGDVITETTLYNEAAMMVSVIINRFRRGDATVTDKAGNTTSSWELVASESGQFEGYAAGMETLNSGNFGNNGDPTCEELRIAVRALEDVSRNGVVNNSVHNWRAVVQDDGRTIRRQGRNNATRIGGTDFW